MRVSSPVTKRNPRPRKYASAAARQAAYRSRNEMLEFRAEPHTAETLTRIADTIDVSRSDLLLSMVKFALANHDWARFGLTHKTIPYYEGNPIMATRKPTAKQLEARARFAEMARSGAFKKRKANPASKGQAYFVHANLGYGVSQHFKVTAIPGANAARSAANQVANHLGYPVFVSSRNERPTSEGLPVIRYEYIDNDQTKAVDLFVYPVKREGVKYTSIKTNPRSRKKTVSQKISQLRHEGYPQKQAVAVALSEERAGKVKRNPSRGVDLDAWLDEYARLENMNLHGENVVRLAELVGTKADVTKAKKILADHEKRGYLSPEDSDARYKLHRKLWPKVSALLEKWHARKNKAKTNPQKRKVSAVVLMNPKARRVYTVYCQAPGQSINSWTKLADFYSAEKAKQYAKAYAKANSSHYVRVESHG